VTYTNADDDQAFAAARQHAAQLSAGAGTPHQQGGTRTGARAGTGTITPGWILYSRWQPLDPVGIVVDIDHYTYVDPDTGEMTPRTRYRTYNPWRPANPWQNLDAADVDPTQGGLDLLAASDAVRALLKPLVLSRSRNRRARRLTAAEIAIVRDASVLARAVAP